MIDLLARLDHVARVGEGWSARCPAHEDRRASLSIGKGTNGAWLLKCHASCPLESILGALQLAPADLFPPRPARASHRRIVAEYHYRDERGTLLFDIVRFEPKKFRPRRPDGQWTMNQVRYVLYRLPELQGHRVCFFTEGEKDADRLAALGLTATCHPFGAGKWRDEYGPQLTAAGVQRVAIVPDNDAAGDAHAQIVARACVDVGLRVTVVPLPGLAPKGDISDYLADHSRDDLLALAAAAPVWTAGPEAHATAAADPTRDPVIVRLAEVAPEAVQWLWPGRLARGKYHLVSGEPGVGKSHLLLDAAARLSRGQAWPDHSGDAPLGRTLILAAEDDAGDTIRPRLDRLGGDPTQISILTGFRNRAAPEIEQALTLTRDLDMLAAAIAQEHPTLIVIDPITAYLGGVDTHRDADTRAVLAPLIKLVAGTDAALVAIGHLSKDAQRAALHRPGGSIAFVAAARIVLGVVADPQATSTGPRRSFLVPLKSNISAPSPTLAFCFNDSTGLAWEPDAVDLDIEALFRPTTPADREAQTEAEVLLRQLFEDEAWPLAAKAASAAARAHGIADRTLRRAANKLGIRIARQGFGNKGQWLWHKPAAIGASIGDIAVPEHRGVSPMAPMENPSENTHESAPSRSIGDIEKCLPARAREDDTTSFIDDHDARNGRALRDAAWAASDERFKRGWK
jgi:hypothetical protein